MRRPSVFRRRCIGLTGVALCIAIFIVQAARLPAATADAAAELAAQRAILETRARSLGIRGVLRFALEAAGNDWDPAAVADALRLARSMQDTAAASEHFGNFRWRLGDPAVTDTNAVEFATQLTALLRLEHHDRLSAAARELLDAIHRDALVALRRHAVKPGYTNIYLMKTWNHLALGQVYGAEIEQAGTALWDEWLAYTLRHGITEYLSPTYYGTDLDSLGLIARHAREERVRHQAEAALAHIWAGIAANWFAPAQRLAGPHSRDYDYLLGRGYLDEHLFAAGWLTEPPEQESAAWLPGAPRRQLLVFRSACRWDPPAHLQADIAQRVPRFVVQRFNAEPWARSTNHVGAALAIGIAGECRGPEDKSLNINLPGTAATANVTLVFDGRGDPYGRHKEPTSHGGQSKAHHLRTFLVSSQRGPRITAAWLFDPSVPAFKVTATDLTCLQAHLIMPVDTELWTRDGLVDAAGKLPANGVVFLRKGQAAVGIRSLTVPAAGLAPPHLELHVDGSKIRAKRLTAVFCEGSPTGRAVLGLDIEAREDCDDERFEKFRGEFAGRAVTAVLAGDRLRIDGSLPLEADIAKLERITCEPLLPDGALLLVNGLEVGQSLLSGE